MNKKETLIEKITSAFSEVEQPPSWSLTNSREGTEPELLEQEFADVPEWEGLTAGFLDSAPDGFGTALSFFSDEAFRYYLPAYLIASIQDKLQRADPLFYLTHGLEQDSADTLLNPRRYGSRTWRDYAHFRHSVFNPEQVDAIAAYLEHELQSGRRTGMEQRQIREALQNYWKKRIE